jgi:hypothetical protein
MAESVYHRMEKCFRRYKTSPSIIFFSVFMFVLLNSLVRETEAGNITRRANPTFLKATSPTGAISTNQD